MDIDIGRFLAKRALVDGARPALIAGAGRFSFAALDAAARRTANLMLARGLGPGDRVAALLRNDLDYVALYYGAAKIGAILTAINWRLAPPEIAYILSDSEPKVLVHDAEFAPAVAALRRTGCPHLVAGDSFASELRAAPETEPTPPATDADRALLLVYT